MFFTRACRPLLPTTPPPTPAPLPSPNDETHVARHSEPAVQTWITICCETLSRLMDTCVITLYCWKLGSPGREEGKKRRDAHTYEGGENAHTVAGRTDGRYPCDRFATDGVAISMATSRPWWAIRREAGTPCVTSVGTRNAPPHGFCEATDLVLLVGEDLDRLEVDHTLRCLPGGARYGAVRCRVVCVVECDTYVRRVVIVRGGSTARSRR